MTSLRSVHDFALALLEPTLAMTERGLPVSEQVRLQMLADLDAELEPLKANVTARAVSALRAAKKVARRSLFVPKLLKPALVERVVAEGLPEVRAKKATRATLERYLMARGAYWSFSATSHDQRKILLYDILKLPKRFKTVIDDGVKRVVLTTNEEALKSLLPHDKHGIIAPLLRISKCSTTRSLLNRIAPAPDGRIRTWYNIAGTETGRFSSAETFLEPQSTNLQNLSKKQGMLSTLYDVRRCVCPPEGWALLDADLSQAEARVVAALCGGEALLRQWQDPNFDVHIFTASHIFNKDASSVTKAERFLGKVARHALNYGMGWETQILQVLASALIKQSASLQLTTSCIQIYRFGGAEWRIALTAEDGSLRILDVPEPSTGGESLSDTLMDLTRRLLRSSPKAPSQTSSTEGSSDGGKSTTAVEDWAWRDHI
jgi:hypothetical protein